MKKSLNTKGTLCLVMALLLVFGCWGCTPKPTESPLPLGTEQPAETPGDELTEEPSAEPTMFSTEAPIDVVTDAPSLATSPSPTPATVMYIQTTDVRLRAQPSGDAQILSLLPPGQSVSKLGEAGAWSHVVCNGLEGYVSSQFLGPQNPKGNVPTATAAPTIAPTATAVLAVVPTPVVVRTGKHKIAIDAGHQGKGNNASEPIGPGASESKPKVASGTTGVSTRVPEYQLTLEISMQLKAELIARGYEVFMIRESHDVDISNKQRAVMAAESGSDILVRIHANGSDNKNDAGILTISPTANTPYIPHLYADSAKLSQTLLAGMVAATGASDRGVWKTDTMSGINWSTIPVSIVEMGFMTNPAEDERMQTKEYQQKLVQGIANGIDRFFE